MIYQKFRDTDLTPSRLGLGCMRLPTAGDGTVDYAAAEKLLDAAYAGGINYFDTAYPYHGGQSERVVGRILSKYPRDTWFLADKMPAFELNSLDQAKAIFQEQLDRCGVDYFDFYLCHSVNENTIGRFLDYGVVDFLQERKAAGQIKHLGFSNHGAPACFERFLDAADWDFVQLQLNYLDWEHHDGRVLYELAQARGIPVMVMEPVRGGRLAALTPALDARLTAAAPGRSVASWAMRWMQGKPGVQVILSGMSDEEQLRDNLATFDRFDPLSPEEETVLDGVLEEFMEQFSVPCTACRYCTDACPMSLRIPDILNIYNELLLTESMMPYIKASEQAEDCQSRNCIGCGACSQRCPQGIDIPGTMQAMTQRLQDWFATHNTDVP